MELIRSSKHDKKCKKCNSKFTYTDNQSWWDYSGMTDTKLVRCPNCNTINVIKYIESSGLYVNSDQRYY